jgi:hypothetical protein
MNASFIFFRRFHNAFIYFYLFISCLFNDIIIDPISPGDSMINEYGVVDGMRVAGEIEVFRGEKVA